MSGPKVSAYELTQMQRARLAEMRRQREAMLAEERRRKKLIEERHKHLLADTANFRAEITSISTKVANLSPVIAEYTSIFGEPALKDTQQHLMRAAGDLSAALFSVKATHTNEEIEAALRGVPQKISETKKQAEALGKAVDDARVKLQAELDESTASLFSSISIEKDSEEAEKSSQVLWAKGKIASYLEMEYLPAALRESLEEVDGKIEAQEERGTLENFISIELQPILKECDEVQGLWQELGPQYEELSTIYQVMLEEAGKQDTGKEIPFHAGAVSELNQAISKLQADIQAADEQRYIVQALNEVMDEMGYDLWGEREVRKRSGTHFQNKLYHFSGETAISVTYRNDGQIAMELGKVDTCDRLPGQNESLDLESQMVTFCDRFREIEQKLVDKGVVLRNRVALSPPSKEYAQVINISDFKRRSSFSAEKRTKTKQDARHIEK